MRCGVEMICCKSSGLDACHPERTREGATSIVDRRQILREYAQDDKPLILIA